MSRCARVLPVTVLFVSAQLRICSPWAAAAEVSDSLRVAEPFVVEQIAAPPLVERPMLASFDDQGRLYVADSAGVNLRGEALLKDPPHVIRILQDTDGDGHFDTSQVFADRLVFPQGILWHDNWVYVASPPSFWRLKDTDDDDRADVREELVTGFANTGVADDLHGASLGPDGRIYWCAGRFPHAIRRPGGPLLHEGRNPFILRCRADGSELELVCGAQGNAVGVAFSPEGDFFSSGTFLASDSMGPGLRDAILHCVDGGAYPVRGQVVSEHQFTGPLLPPLTHLGVAASADIMFHRSRGDREPYHLYSALFNMHKIVRHVLSRNGATFQCTNVDFLTSSHPDFHPTDVLEDADGSLLVIDTGGWFRIGCPTSQVAKPQVLGGIYRVRRREERTLGDPRGRAIDWRGASPRALSRLLGDRRFAVVDRAMVELARRGDSSVDAVTKVLQTAASPKSRKAAVWTLCRIDTSRSRAAMRSALRDADPTVRQAAARAAGLCRDADLHGRLVELVTRDAPAVRREAATALGRIGSSAAAQPLLDALDGSMDRFLEHAMLYALIRINDRETVLHGLDSDRPAVIRGALVVLDQMESGALAAEQVLPLLNHPHPAVRETAQWVIGHRAAWGRQMVPVLHEMLAERQRSPTENRQLRAQLAVFGGEPAVQEMLAGVLGRAETAADTRRLVLEAVLQSRIRQVPWTWREPLRTCLRQGTDDVTRLAAVLIRKLRPDTPRVVQRIDPQIDFGPTNDSLAGTGPKDNFGVRWSGLIRVPRNAQYRFFLASDDGSRLFIEGQLVVDHGGRHGLSEKSGTVNLTEGDHRLTVEFFDHRSQAACRLSWDASGAKQVVPPDVLFHFRNDSALRQQQLAPGLRACYLQLTGRGDTFPDLSAGVFDPWLLETARNTGRDTGVRIEALLALTPGAHACDDDIFKLLLSGLGAQQPVLLRTRAAEALSTFHLETEQLLRLSQYVPTSPALVLQKLLPVFEGHSTPLVGRTLVAALSGSSGLASLTPGALDNVLAGYPAEVVQSAEPLYEQLHQQSQGQLARLERILKRRTGRDPLRGREIFFGKKALCGTCHAVGSEGGRVGPDLTAIARIRTERDLLEAVLLPNASFARGYEPYTIVTTGGLVHTGIMETETTDQLVIRMDATNRIVLQRGEIDRIVPATTSIMPKGLDVQLADEELADLIAYLLTLK